MTDIYVVQYERYTQRPRSIDLHSTYIDSAFTDPEKASRRAEFLNEDAERDYSQGTRARVYMVQVDPEVYMSSTIEDVGVTEAKPIQTGLEWTIECQVRDLENNERDFDAAKREDYDSDEAFKTDVAYYIKAIADGEARLAALKEQFSAKLGPLPVS